MDGCDDLLCGESLSATIDNNNWGGNGEDVENTTRRDVTRKHKEVFLCCRDTEDEAQGIDFKMPVITISFVEVNCGKTRQDKTRAKRR